MFFQALYIFGIIACVAVFISLVIKGKQYLEDEDIELDIPENEEINFSPFILLLTFCPILNIILAFFIVDHYNEILEQLIDFLWMNRK